MEKMAVNRIVFDSAMYDSLGLYGSSKTDPETPRVLSLISSLLEKSIKKNEGRASRKKGAITIFHGQRAPALSIGQYIERIFKYVNCSTSCFVLAYMYINGFVQQTGSCITSLNVHRLLITSVMLAAKYADDECLNNAYYAKVGGVSRAEMNRLEMKLLFSLDFRLHVTVETFRSACLKLEKEVVGEELPIQRIHKTKHLDRIGDGYNCRVI